MSDISGFIKIEKKEQLLNGRFDFPRQMIWAAGIVMGAVAAHYILIILQTSLGEDVIPTYLPSSLFGMQYVYVTLALITLSIHYIIHPKLFGFAEINNNRCNLLIKMGLATAGITAARLTATLIAAAVTYSVGYVLTFIFSMLIRLNFVLNYIISLYFVGLYAVLFFTMLSMMLALLLNRQKLNFITTVFSLVITVVLLAAFGYYGYLEPETLATNISSMMDFKIASFLNLVTFLIIVLYALCVIVGSGKSGNFIPQFFNPDQLAGDYIADEVMTTRTAVLVAAQKKLAAPNQPIKPGSVAPMSVPRAQQQAHKLPPPVEQKNAPTTTPPPQQQKQQRITSAEQTTARPIINSEQRPPRQEQRPSIQGERLAPSPGERLSPDQSQPMPPQRPPMQAQRPSIQGERLAPSPGERLSPDQRPQVPPQRPPMSDQRPPMPDQRPPMPGQRPPMPGQRPPMQRMGTMGTQSMPPQRPPMQPPNDFRGAPNQFSPPKGFGGFDDVAQPVVKMSIAKLIFGILFGLVGLALLVMTLMSLGIPDPTVDSSGAIAVEGAELLRLIKGFTSKGLNLVIMLAVAGMFLASGALLVVMSTGKVVNDNGYYDDDDDDDDYDDDDEYY